MYYQQLTLLLLIALISIASSQECFSSGECEMGSLCSETEKTCQRIKNFESYPSLVAYESQSLPDVKPGPRPPRNTHNHHTKPHSCGNSAMTKHRAHSKNRLDIPTCGKSTCDTPSVRDGFSKTRATTVHNVNHIVFNCTPSWYLNAAKMIPIAMADANVQFASTGFRFTSTISYYACNYQGVNTTAITDVVAFTLLLLLRGVNYRDNRELYLLTGDNPDLLGFMTLPDSNYTGLGFVNSGEYAPGKSTIGHELGHGFGLQHTFAGYDEVGPGCSQCYELPGQGDVRGDFCSDTSFAPKSFDCVATIPATGNFADICANRTSWPNQINNMMSYAVDAGCVAKTVTTQQSNRMRCFYQTDMVWLQRNQTSSSNSVVISLMVLFVALFICFQ